MKKNKNTEELKYKLDPYDNTIYTKDEYVTVWSERRDDNTTESLETEWDLLRDVTIGYDSEADTLKHIKRVNQLLIAASMELLKRASVHDDSKLLSPEKEGFDEYTPRLKGAVYGSDEYKGFLEGLKVSLDHHYANNTHHPEHYKAGVNGMDLFDLLEMFFDWRAATERTANGNIYTSIEYNKVRFGLSDQVVAIFINTANKLGYSQTNKRRQVFTGTGKKQKLIINTLATTFKLTDVFVNGVKTNDFVYRDGFNNTSDMRVDIKCKLGDTIEIDYEVQK